MKILYKSEGYKIDGQKYKDVKFLKEETAFMMGYYERKVHGPKDELGLCLSMTTTIFLNDVESFKINGEEFSTDRDHAWDIIEEISKLMVFSQFMIFEKITDCDNVTTINIETE